MDAIYEMLKVCEFAESLIDDAATYLAGEHILPCDESIALAESLAILAKRLRATIYNVNMI